MRNTNKQDDIIWSSRNGVSDAYELNKIIPRYELTGGVDCTFLLWTNHNMVTGFWQWVEYTSFWHDSVKC